MKGWLAKLMLAAVSATLTLALAEVALRLAEPKKTRLFRFNPRVIYELTPDAERSYTHSRGNGGHTVTTTINAAGFRGENLQADPGRRIVVYGDSFIQAEFSARESTFSGRLASELARMCPGPTEVVNAGVIGYGPDQVLRKMESDLPRLAPDLVIVSVFADNDFGDLIRNRIFSLSPSGDLQENPLKMSRSLQRSLGIRRDLALTKLARKAYWHWLTWRQVRQVTSRDDSSSAEAGAQPSTQPVDKWLQDAQAEFENTVKGQDRTVRRIDYDFYDADISLQPDSESARYKVRLMSLILKQIKAVLDASSYDRLLMIIPSPIDACEDYDFDVDKTKYPRYDPRALTSAVVAGAKTAGLPHVSLWDTFAANDPNSLYFHHGNNHWNDRGQTLAAAVVARRISARYWPECQTTATGL